MSTFVLMELCKQSGVKNVIYQLLAPNITINLDDVEENRSYAVVIDKGIRYCLTGTPGIYDEEAPDVLLTDRTPTKQKLIDNDIRQRRWIKHPNLIIHRMRSTSTRIRFPARNDTKSFQTARNIVKFLINCLHGTTLCGIIKIRYT